MLGIFDGMTDNCLEIFMDDLSVYGSSFQSCLDNLRQVLQRCIDKNLVLNWEKCYFMVQKGRVLGHIVSKKWLEVDLAKVDLIKNLPKPRTIKEI
jgi:hypothetical protein